jgi:hypothetical protein
MSISMVWIAAMAAGEARAEVTRCEQPMEVRSELAADGIIALVVRGVDAPVRIVSGAEQIGATATTCAPDRVKVRVKRTGNVAVATVSAPADSGVGLVVSVPVGIAAVTVERLTGPLEVHDVPARLAVVSSDGPIDVSGVQSLRVGYTTGPLTVASLNGSLSVDEHTGDLSANDIGGNVTVAGIVGAVAVDRVQGRLEVTENIGSVAQSNVQGEVVTR